MEALETRETPSTVSASSVRLTFSEAISPTTELSVVVFQSRPMSEAPGVGIADNIYSFQLRSSEQSPATLEGHECLVFYLGGIPTA